MQHKICSNKNTVRGKIYFNLLGVGTIYWYWDSTKINILYVTWIVILNKIVFNVEGCHLIPKCI